MRQNLQIQQEQVSAKREELAGASQRLASAEEIEHRLLEGSRQAEERLLALRSQRSSHHPGTRSKLDESSAETIRQVGSLRAEEKSRIEESQDRSSKPNGKKPAAAPPIWMTRSAPPPDARRSFARIPPTAKWKKPATIPTASIMRQSCVTELNAQPEELIGLESDPAPRRRIGRRRNQLQRHEGAHRSHGPGQHDGPRGISRSAKQRDGFLRRERDDLCRVDREHAAWPSANSIKSRARNSTKPSPPSTPASPSPSNRYSAGAPARCA